MPAADIMVPRYLADHAGTLAVATLVRRLATISKAYSESLRAMVPGIEFLRDCPINRGGVVYPEDSPVFILHRCDKLASESHVVMQYTHATGRDCTLYYTKNVALVAEAVRSATIQSVDDIQV